MNRAARVRLIDQPMFQGIARQLDIRSEPELLGQSPTVSIHGFFAQAEAAGDFLYGLGGGDQA